MPIKRKPTPHPNQTKTPDEIGYRVIKEYWRKPVKTGNPKNMIVLWVIAWVRGEGPQLEKRRIYDNPRTGKLSTYKLCGFTAEDLKFIQDNKADIEEALRS